MEKKRKAVVSGYVTVDAGKFLLAGKGFAPAVYVDEEDYAGVRRAAEDLCGDIQAVTGILPVKPKDWDKADLVIGTVGRNRVIDFLVEQHKLDVSEIAGKWECFQIQTVENRLIIAGSDKRGTIYGIYDLCEKIGVSPWKWWADVRPGTAENLYVNLDQPYREPEPSVRYRGIFINDEYAFDNWALGRGDRDFVETYKKVFELLLRLKANLLWPAMHDGSPCFHQNRSNAENADLYGIVIGTSHCEMMLRNNVSEYFSFEERWEKENPDRALYKKKLSDSPLPCAYVYTDSHPDTGERVYNKELLCRYWEESVRQYGIYECIFTMGMRGLHDASWQPVEAETIEHRRMQLEEIIGMQRNILERTLQKPAEEIPQLFIPYKEIQEVYDSGMKLPEDMMLMWTDDNYGYIRRLPEGRDGKRKTMAGGEGIYYHAGYHGSPNSYIWLSTTPYALMKEEMCKAYHCGAGKIWMLNVGDLKPAEGRMEYFLRLARDIADMEKMDLQDYMTARAIRDFGFDMTEAAEYAAVELDFQRQVYGRKPEHFRRGLFNYMSYGDEGMRYLQRYEALVKRSEDLYGLLEDDIRPAFYQLQLYPLRACRHIAAKYVYADKAELYQAQERGSAINKYGLKSDEAYFRLLEDTKEYNSLEAGKWNLLMNPYQSYFRSRGAVLSAILPKPSCGELGYAELGVCPEEPVTFYGTVRNQRYVDLYNKGKGYVDWEITSDREWVKFSKNKGTIYQEERIWINMEWEKVSRGITSASVIVSGMGENKKQQNVEITVIIDNREREAKPGVFVEVDGVISMEAEHYGECVGHNGAEWKTEKYLGRNGDALKLYPDCLASVEHPDRSTAAYVSYPIQVDTPGDILAEVYRIPTLNEGGRMRLAVGLDDQEPVILEGTNAYVNDSDGTDRWGRGVLENTEILSAYLPAVETGSHTLLIYQVDPGMILDKMVLYAGGKGENCPSSYFGSPETMCLQKPVTESIF